MTKRSRRPAQRRRPRPRTRCRAAKPRSFRPNSISGRALLAVIAIMTFLAALTLGAVVLVRSASGDWQSAVAREVTIQIRPVGPARRRGGRAARRRDRAEHARHCVARGHTAGKSPPALLEPWLGSGLDLGELPVPRLIVLKVACGRGAGLREAAPAACRNPRRHARRSSRPHRPHARDRAQRRRDRARACSRWCSPPR